MGIFSSKFELVNSDSQSWSIFKGKDVSLTNHDFWPKFSEGMNICEALPTQVYKDISFLFLY